MPRIAPRQMIGLLLCLGITPAAAQDNPWRVPGNPTDGWFGYGNAPQPYGGQVPGSETWTGGRVQQSQPSVRLPGVQNGVSSGSQGWSTAPRTDPPAWDAAPRPANGGYAALPPNRVQPGLPGSRSMTDTFPQAFDSGGTYQRPRQDGPRYGGFPDDRHLEAPPASRAQVQQPPRIMLGEFPPLEGERRLPSSERLDPPRREPPPEGEWRTRQAPPPAPAYGQPYGDGYGRAYERYGQGYGQGYGQAYDRNSERDRPYDRGYGQPYGSAPYAARDPALAGPSTLTNPWGAGAGSGLYPGYPSPYGAGVPGPYGW